MLESACKSLNAAIIALDLATSSDFIDTLINLQKIVKSNFAPENSPSVMLAWLYPIKKPLDIELALSNAAFSIVLENINCAKKSLIESGVNSIIQSKEFAEVISILDQVELFKGRS